MSMISFQTVAPDFDGQRLDRAMKKMFPHIAFGQMQKLIRTGQIRIDGKRAKADTVLSEGQELRLPPQLTAPNAPLKKEKKVSDEDAAWLKSLIVYQDESIIALNKPHGLAVQGGSKTTRHIDGLLPALKNKDGIVPKLVHRLDKDTSGLLVLARTPDAARVLSKAFQGRDVQKLYLALCAPTPNDHGGTIKAALAKVPTKHKDREMMRFDPENGKKAVTDFEVLDCAAKRAALIAFKPLTGRTHQIRVHAALMGAPILGDQKYAFDFAETHDDILPLLKYQNLHLHSFRLALAHPKTGRLLELEAPLSPEIRGSLKTLGLTLQRESDFLVFTNA